MILPAILIGGVIACGVDPVSPVRSVTPSAFIAVGDSICYEHVPGVDEGHPCTDGASDGTMSSLGDEAARLSLVADTTCQRMGATLQGFVDRGSQGVREWHSQYVYQGNIVTGDYHTVLPNEIHIWSDGGNIPLVGRHETAHAMGMQDYGVGDPDPATGFAGDPTTMGAYALSTYCGNQPPVI
ncbi:MAG: hypothetical protein ABI338_03985 [Gemmatimonadaceae bacterium]